MATVTVVQPKVGTITVLSQTDQSITVEWDEPDEGTGVFKGFKLYCHACGGTLVYLKTNPATFDISELTSEGHPGVLILDEPTNHLDINSREALLNALDDFPGTVIIVSHDRFFLDSLATRILSIENGKSFLYEGNYSQYLWARERRLADEQDSLAQQSAYNDVDQPKVIDSKQQARDTVKLQKQLSNKLQRLKKDIEAKENEIAELEAKISQVEAQLASPPEGWSPAKIAEVAQQHSSLNKKLDDAMGAWENLNSENDQTSEELKAIREGR